MKELFANKFAKLIEVRKIMALMICIVFCSMSALGKIPSEVFVPIVTSVFGFYFGQYVQK